MITHDGASKLNREIFRKVMGSHIWHYVEVASGKWKPNKMQANGMECKKKTKHQNEQKREWKETGEKRTPF